MKYNFIYPSNPFDSKKVDETFEEEYNAVKIYFSPLLIDVDQLNEAKSFQKILNVEDFKDTQYIYRGWMLTPENYQLLESGLQGQLKVSTQEYLSHHYLPNWYDKIDIFTPKSIITTEDNAVNDFNKSGWSQAFVKDYVKSLKTGKGSIVDSSADLARAFKDMKHYRGFIEGGIILREVHDFNPETELRFFVIDSKLQSPVESISENQLNLLVSVINLFPGSFFYSIDLIKDKSGKDWLVEIGDGQVSDCVGWDVDKFAKALSVVNKTNNFKIKI